MDRSWSRRRFVASAMAMVAAPALRTGAAAADEPLILRCSLETAPSHTRNAIIRNYLAKIETAAAGKIKTQLFESGQLFPGLQVGKALLQGQVEMAAPGSFALTGIISDADFLQLPVLYGRPIEIVHRVVDGKPGQLLASQIEARLNAHVIGPWLDLGFFNWYSTSKPLTSYADLKGLKIRNNGGAGQAWRTQFMGAIRQRDEQQRPLLVAWTQHLIGADIDAIEETREWAPYQQPNGEIVLAVAKQGSRNHRNLGRVAVRPVGGRIAPAVQDHDAVDGNLDPIGKARQQHRPRALRFAVRPREGAGVERRIIHRNPGRGKVRQRDRALGAGLLQAEFAHKITGERLRRRLA
jgi:Bacterial extracellular solute-binding protein, family 7